MREKSYKTLFGLSPMLYGVVSLIATGLAITSSVLNVFVGIVFWLAALLPLLFIGVAAGLLGLGAGIYFKNWLGIVTGILGLVTISFGVWWSFSNLNSW